MGCGYGLPPAVGRRRSSGRWPSRDLPLVSLSKYPRAVCGGVGARGRRRQNVDQLGHAWCACTARVPVDGRPTDRRRPPVVSRHLPAGCHASTVVRKQTCARWRRRRRRRCRCDSVEPPSCDSGSGDQVRPCKLLQVQCKLASCRCFRDDGGRVDPTSRTVTGRWDWEVGALYCSCRSRGARGNLGDSIYFYLILINNGFNFLQFSSIHY